MTPFMRKDGNATTTAAAPPDKAASYEIGEDEAGMRLDRWLHRRFPEVSNSHLMRIVRKGEVRVSGKRADVSTRLAGMNVANDVILDHCPVGLFDVEVENARLFVIDPDDGMIIRHGGCSFLPFGS